MISYGTMNNTALVIGGTGLVGSNLIEVLLGDGRFNKVISFGRRATGLGHMKLEEHIIDFDKPEEWAHLVKGDVLFSTLGTTLKKAGSKAAQYKIDYTYQYEMANIAAQNGVDEYVLVSAAFSSLNSKVFYSRMKAELERDVKKLPFKRIRIMRPGMLMGDRQPPKPGEEFVALIMGMIAAIPGLKRFRPIHAKTVAQAMAFASFDTTPGIKEYTLEDIFKRARI